MTMVEYPKDPFDDESDCDENIFKGIPRKFCAIILDIRKSLELHRMTSHGQFPYSNISRSSISSLHECASTIPGSRRLMESC